jgi:hypothetical protein
MDSILAVLPVFSFIVVISLIVSAVRRAVEGASPGVVQRWWWRDLTLVVLPMAAGAALAYVTAHFEGADILFPKVFQSTFSRVVLFGLPFGGLSGTLYRVGMTVARKAVEQKFGVTLPAALDDAIEGAPPAPPPTAAPAAPPAAPPVPFPPADATDQAKGKDEKVGA